MNFKINQLFVLVVISLKTLSASAGSSSIESQNLTDLIPNKINLTQTQYHQVNNITVNAQTSFSTKPSESSVETKNVSSRISAIPQTIFANVSTKEVPNAASTTLLPAVTTSKPVVMPSASPYDVEVLKVKDTPDVERWVVRNTTTNMTCIIAQMAMQLNVTYPANNNQTGNATIDVPVNNAKLNGSCSESHQSIKIEWGPGHWIEINFAVNSSAKDYFVSDFSLNVNASIFNNVKNETGYIKFENKKPQFLTPLDMSYKCDREQKINLTSETNNLPAVVTLKNTQFEAYMNSSKTEFGAAQDCDFFDTPDIVPIAVGCALAILVLVVLVAYLIGRKRSQNRGYLSM